MSGAANTGNLQKDGRFAKGQSGNPKGRPLGSRNKATLAAEALLEGGAERLTRKAIDLACEGDTTALRLCLERLVPPRRERAVTFDMPAIESAQQAQAAMASVLSAVARGDLLLSEAIEMSKLIDIYLRADEARELTKRLDAIEEGMKKP
jgi:hypothetical protein